MSFDHQVREVARLVTSARRVAVLTGAGISTPSGIPDFRSASGIYARENSANVFDIRGFMEDPSAFYRFARWFYPVVKNARPNAAHEALARWERAGKDVRIATQNIDDLHQRAGSTRVYPVHGTMLTSTCSSCGRRVATAELEKTVLKDEQVPRCDCGGVFKPDITFFGEMLPQDAWNSSMEAMAEADLVLVIGTSLVVFPAASLPHHRRAEAHLAIVNRDPTALDYEADVVCRGDLAEALGRVDAALREE